MQSRSACIKIGVRGEKRRLFRKVRLFIRFFLTYSSFFAMLANESNFIKSTLLDGRRENYVATEERS